MLVADGGDFVATASYILEPRSPLSWLDPGAYGTLGVGAGFALGRKTLPAGIRGVAAVRRRLGRLHPLGVRHLRAPQHPGDRGGRQRRLLGQIAREQEEILHDDVGCTLGRSSYERAAEGLGARGLLLRIRQRSTECSPKRSDWHATDTRC